MDMMHTLAELTAAYGPSGMEKGVAGVIEKIAASYCDEVTYDVMGNLFCHTGRAADPGSCLPPIWIPSA